MVQIFFRVSIFAKYEFYGYLDIFDMPFKIKFRMYLFLRNRPNFAKFAKICRHKI